MTRYTVTPSLDIYDDNHEHFFQFRTNFGVGKLFWTNKKEEVRGAVHVVWHRLAEELSDLELGENNRQLYQGVDVMVMSENFRRYNHPIIYAHAIID